MKNNVTIAGVEIYRDEQGRYNLNALHRSSGNDSSKAPAQWLRLKGTQELIEELTDMQIHTSLVNSVKGGVEQGTFAHELLAVSYAGWISASFQLKVNQAFIDSKKTNNEFQLPQTFSEALLLAHEQAKQLEEQAPKVRYFDKVSKNETHMNATQVGQKFKMSATILNRHLTEHGIYNKSIKRSKVFNQWFIDKEYGEMKQTELGYSQSVFTTKGEQFISELLTSEGII